MTEGFSTIDAVIEDILKILSEEEKDKIRQEVASLESEVQTP